MNTKHTNLRAMMLAALAILALACGKNAVIGKHDDGIRTSELDDGSEPADGGACAAHEQAFDAFVAAHKSCTDDIDCAIIGDCGPFAEFVAVRADAAKEAWALMQATCDETFNGPIYDAVCEHNACERRERTDTCCGCPTSDGGLSPTSL